MESPLLVLSPVALQQKSRRLGMGWRSTCRTAGASEHLPRTRKRRRGHWMRRVWDWGLFQKKIRQYEAERRRNSRPVYVSLSNLTKAINSKSKTLLTPKKTTLREACGTTSEIKRSAKATTTSQRSQVTQTDPVKKLGRNLKNPKRKKTHLIKRKPHTRKKAINIM